MGTVHEEQLDTHEQRRAPIERSDHGYEITLSSQMDEALTFFVSFAAAKRWAPKSSTSSSEPFTET